MDIDFLAPTRLILLALPLALGVAYLVMQARRRRYALRFTTLDLLDEVAPDKPGWRRHLPAVLLLVGLVVAASALGASALRSATTSVSVTAGKPSEIRFVLSKRSVTKGTVVFKVANKGTVTHDFRIAGKKTAKIPKGKSALLRVVFKKGGKFPYLCTVPGHAAAGMSRDDLKELGESLDAGEAGLVVVAVSDMGAKVKEAMRRAEKVEAKELKADTADIERDANAAEGGTSAS